MPLLTRRSSDSALSTSPAQRLSDRRDRQGPLDLGVLLRNWLTQADADEGRTESRFTSDEKRELVELRKEKRRLEVEVEILKRSAAYFAREDVLPK